MTSKKPPRRTGGPAPDDLDIGLGRDDVPDDDHVSLVRTGSGATFLPAGWAARYRDNEPVMHLVAHLQSRALQVRVIREDLDVLVPEARKQGASWDLIGWCLDMTGHGARARWGDR